jgi:hypothetical protein
MSILCNPQEISVSSPGQTLPLQIPAIIFSSVDLPPLKPPLWLSFFFYSYTNIKKRAFINCRKFFVIIVDSWKYST